MNELLRRILFLPPQSSTVAAGVDQLHFFVITVTMLGALAVTLIGGYFLLRYRRRFGRVVGVTRKPAKPIPFWLEAAVVLGLFGLFTWWWIIGFRQYMRMRIAPEGALEVYVTAKQWMWKFAYPRGANSIATLYVPAGRPVKLILASRDVIHSFFVPDFRVKQDVVPGRLTTLWFEAPEPGRHEILCTEYCGVSHSTMRGEVVVLSAEDYDRWLEGALPNDALAGETRERPAVVGRYAPSEPVSMVRQGELAAAQFGCLRCHSLDGSPHLGPTWAGFYGSTVPLAKGGSVIADEAYITESMMDPAAKLHAGFTAIMPSYQGLMKPAETAAIVELIKSLRFVQSTPGREWPGGITIAPDGSIQQVPEVKP
ncbi:MAG TPA: cytochrome c oxidase subunit II [Polyangium sp.]|nr:cytochrome c oxidase subunit II [Polyangium sp.]